MPKNIESELRARVDSFVADLSSLIHEAALEAVHDALGTVSAPPRRKTTKRTKRGKRAKTAKRTKRGKRVRRSSEELDRLGSDFLAYVQKNPGERLEQIGAGMSTDTAELKRPVQILLEEKKVKTEGQRRGTKYYPSSDKGKTRKKAAKRRKTTKKKTA